MPIIGEIRKDYEIGRPKNYIKYIWAACELCGKERWVVSKAGKPQNKFCVHCFLKTRSGENNHNWKGGRFKTVDGYWLVIAKDHPNVNHNGYMLEHRLVMEQELGRYLTRQEDVHHLNGIKGDNRPENLAVMKHGEHRQLVLPFQERIKELELTIQKLIRSE